MKRTRSHIIEDESENILKQILPSEWVLRKLNPDYGIDYLVEIFTQSRATGLHFFIQLKGTDKKGKAGKISFSLSNKHINYYAKLSLPILLIYISVSTKEAWGRWMNRVATSKNVGSRSIPFFAEDLLTKEKITHLGKNLTPNLNCLIRLKFKEFKDKNLLGFLNRWFCKIFENDIAKSENDLADEISISFLSKQKEGLNVRVVDERFLFDTTIVIKDTFKEELLLIPELDDFPQSLKSTLYVLSKVMLVRNSKTALSLMLSVLPTSPNIGFEDMVSIIAKCVANNEYASIKKLGEGAIDENNFDVYQILVISLLKYFQIPEIKQINETLLLYAISKTKDDSLAGIFHYNLGNHYQNNNQVKKSVFHYLQARKKVPDCNAPRRQDTFLKNLRCSFHSFSSGLF